MYCQTYSFYCTPRKRRCFTDDPSKVSKTSAIDKVRILVEQVIRIIKTFKILTTEMSISILENEDDIVLVCVVICKFKEPMHSDTTHIDQI